VLVLSHVTLQGKIVLVDLCILLFDFGLVTLASIIDLSEIPSENTIVLDQIGVSGNVLDDGILQW